MTTETRRLDGNQSYARYTRATDPAADGGNTRQPGFPGATTAGYQYGNAGPAYNPTVQTSTGARTLVLNDPRTQQVQYRVATALDEPQPIPGPPPFTENYPPIAPNPQP